MTKTPLRHLLLLVLALLLSLLATIAVAADDPAARSFGILGVDYKMTEYAHDGQWVVRKTKLTKVDANSDLVLSFEIAKATEMRPSPEWQLLNRFLDTFKELAAGRARLMEAKIDLADQNKVKKLQEEVSQHDQAVTVAVTDLLSFLGKSKGLSLKEINAIFCGTFDGGKKECEKSYANVSRWLRGEIETLEKKAAEFAKKKGEEVEVTVEAFLDPVLGTRKALHIEGYDSLPSGELRPIDRYGVRLNPEERERLAMEIKQAEAAALAINEFQESGNKIQAKSKEFLEELKDNLRSLEKELKEPEKWKSLLETAINKLDELAKAQGTQDDVKNAAAQLVKALEKLTADTQKIKEALTQVHILTTQTENARLETLLLGSNGLLDALSALESSLTSLKTWQEDLKSINENIETLTKKITKPEADRLIPTELKDFLTSITSALAKQFPATVNLVSLLTSNLKISIGTDTLAQTKTELIPHSLDDLPDARLELARAGLTLNDRVTIKVRFKEKDTDKRKGKNIDEATYVTEVTLTGLHRIISADLIFASALSGDESARKWKPNVAALVNWHYTFRSNEPSKKEAKTPPVDPSSGNELRKFWNWLDLGAGIHLASLSQGNEAVQFGVGGNISLWGGLVHGGYGYNLSTNGPYVFIGISLFDVLNRAMRVGKGASPTQPEMQLAR